MPCALIVPLHFEGWEHLSESRIEMKRAIATADLERRLRWPDPSHKLAVLEWLTLMKRGHGGGQPVTTATDTTRPANGLIEALHVAGPAGALADRLSLFGQFVGSWYLEWTGAGTDAQPATMTGELHFGWVLGGRAVQDIWIVPARPAKAGRRWASTARRSGSMTPPSMRGAPPGSNRSTAEYGASSAGATTTASSSSATRTIPNSAGASPTSHRTLSAGAPRPRETAAPPGSLTRRCTQPASAITPTQTRRVTLDAESVILWLDGVSPGDRSPETASRSGPCPSRLGGGCPKDPPGTCPMKGCHRTPPASAPPTNAGGRASVRRVPALDETHNYGETDRELLLRPEAEVLLGRDVRRCWPTARFVRFLQLKAADPKPADAPRSASPPRE
jgi:hypothetical protein